MSKNVRHLVNWALGPLYGARSSHTHIYIFMYRIYTICGTIDVVIESFFPFSKTQIETERTSSMRTMALRDKWETLSSRFILFWVYFRPTSFYIYIWTILYLYIMRIVCNILWVINELYWPLGFSVQFPSSAGYVLQIMCMWFTAYARIHAI